jgi:hypothetical protein
MKIVTYLFLAWGEVGTFTVSVGNDKFLRTDYTQSRWRGMIASSVTFEV